MKRQSLILFVFIIIIINFCDADCDTESSFWNNVKCTTKSATNAVVTGAMVVRDTAKNTYNKAKHKLTGKQSSENLDIGVVRLDEENRNSNYNQTGETESDDRNNELTNNNFTNRSLFNVRCQEGHVSIGGRCRKNAST